MQFHSIPSFLELKSQRKPKINAKKTHLEKLSGLEKTALSITSKIGNMRFFLIILAWTVLWFGWNMAAPDHLKFDALPTFGIWVLVANVIQLMLMPLLLIRQNMQDKYAEVRSEADYEVNIQSEREIEVILRRLEEEESLLQEIMRRIPETRIPRRLPPEKKPAAKQ